MVQGFLPPTARRSLIPRDEDISGQFQKFGKVKGFGRGDPGLLTREEGRAATPGDSPLNHTTKKAFSEYSLGPTHLTSLE